MNGGLGSTALPVNVDWDTVPAGVRVCVCVLMADPEKTSALVVLDEPLKVGIPAGQAIVPLGVPADTPCVNATAAEVVLAVPVALTAVAAREVPVPKAATAICRVVVVEGI